MASPRRKPGGQRGSAALPRLLLLALLLGGPVRPALAGQAATGDAAAMAAALGFTGGEVGYMLTDLDAGRVLAEQSPDGLFLPASVTKLVTAFAAVRILGAQHQFETILYRRGADLYLRGGGDPMLSSRDLQPLLAALQASPPARGGRFFYDESLVGSYPEIDQAQPMAASYNPGFGGLDLNFNRIEVRWKRTAKGTSFAVRSPAEGLDVAVDWIALAPGPPSQPAGQPFVFAGRDGAERWLYSPHLEPAGTVSLPVKNPGRQAALVFRKLAAMAGIRLPPPQPAPTPLDAAAVARVASPALAEIVAKLLKHSNNMSAELVGLAASRVLSGGALTPDPARSAALLTGWLERQLPAVDWRGFMLANHSGLATASRVSPRQLTALLGLVASDPDFAALLPEVKSDEELVLASAGTEQRPVVAKSGTMDYARGLAGLMIGRDGHRLAFAIMIFDAGQRSLFDASFDPRVLNPPPEARAWMKRARALDEALLMQWSQNY
jgi:D-alanyl-D-alanine carboxypeptidase/D-alanyl-D-alanine-endopeptidase (penicillin-binding protein 4)